MKHGIIVDWDDLQTKACIRWDFYGVWSWDDWYAGMETALALRAEVIDTPIVPAIFNFEHHLHPPFTGLLPNIRNGGELMDPRDFVVAAYPSGFVRRIIEVYLSIHPVMRERVFVVHSLDDARRLMTEEVQARLLHVPQRR